MVPKSLFPLSIPLNFEDLEEGKDQFILKLSVANQFGECPVCGCKSYNQHSSYTRTALDLPWAGTSVEVQLSVRKFYCKNDDCDRQIFTERLGEGLPPYARRTKRLNEHLNKISYTLGGNAGADLAKYIGIPISSSTMLRTIKKIDVEIDTSDVRVLGIDDWAFKKGRSYGTILVDLEKRKPIDLLPDRETETVKKWLEEHPSIEIISRDRASCYALAADQGAPQAVQVADRWHLLKNLGDALKRMLDKHNQELRQAARQIAEANKVSDEVVEEVVEEKEVSTDGKDVSEEPVLSKFELNFQEVKRLHSLGCSIRSIFRQTGIHRQTIKKYLEYEEYPQKAFTTTRTSKALPFEKYLRKRWDEGETNHKQLWKEIKEKGFTGSSSSVYRLISKYPKNKSVSQLPSLAVKIWSPTKVSRLLNKPFEDLDEESQEFLRTFYKLCPEANKASQLARKFKEMTDKLRRKKLDGWIESALDSGIPALKNFAKGLQKDYDAVKAAVSLKWSNGQVEGQVNRLKTIKRQMYGRAGFHLLRKRVVMKYG